MGRKNIKKQIGHEIRSQFCPGKSKRDARAEQGKRNPDGIYSYSTRKNYLRWCIAFAEWHAAKYPEEKYFSLEQIRNRVPEWIREQIERHERGELSAWTIRLQVAAVSKAYHCTSGRWEVDLPKRKRKDIKRSRRETTTDRHVSEKTNADLIAFLQSTGLRRHEVAALRPSEIQQTENGWTVTVLQGKGGKRRTVPVIPGNEDLLQRLSELPADQKIFKKIPQQMDVHGYRRQYAQAMYQRFARPLEELNRKEKYFCRRDLAGVVYDRAAMRTVSLFLGHNRIDVIANNYLGWEIEQAECE